MTIFQFFSLLGGVGLFLYGMSIMSTGLRNACGENIRVILEGATKNKVRAVLIGILVTMLIQSSSATDVMVIGFVNSGFMNLSQAIGVIMGANIGTTITAQITAFNLSAYAPVILFVGAVMFMFMKKDVVKHVGCIIMGFGMLFQGIGLMKEAIKPLAETPSFIKLLSGLNNPIVAVLFGVAFTALLQSSSSATVIFQAFAMQGILDYRTSVFLVIGSAVGSVTPNLLASLTTNRNGKRTAVLNLIFNLIRAVILTTLMLVFPKLMDFWPSVLPNSIGRQIAMTHTTFAVFAVLIMLPFTDYIVKLAQRLIPELPEELRKQEDRKLQYMVNLDDVMPAIGLNQAKLEIARMGRFAVENLKLSLECFFNRDDDLAVQVNELEETVNYLNDEIIAGLVTIRTSDMSQRDLHKLYHLTLAVADVERISDHAENIVEYEQQLRKEKVKLTEDQIKEIRELADMSIHSVEECIKIFETDDFDRLPEAEAMEQQVDVAQEIVTASHIKRLMDEECAPLGSVIITDIAVDLERCSDHAINIAYALADKEPKRDYPIQEQQ